MGFFNKELSPFNATNVEKYKKNKVKEIYVIGRPVNMQVVKQLGAKHMFLILKLDNNICIINHISDSDNGKIPQIIFEEITTIQFQKELKGDIVQKIIVERLIYLEDFFHKAQQHQQNYPNYKFTSDNCQKYCIEILKSLQIKEYIVEPVQDYIDSNRNKVIGTTSLIGFTIIAGLTALGVIINKNKQKKEEKEQEEEETLEEYV